MKTQVIFLRNGTYLIGKYSENSDGTVNIRDGLAFRVVPSNDPRVPGLQFWVAFPFAKEPDNVQLPKDFIHFAMDPNESIEEAHRAQTTGLLTPDKNLVLPKL